MTEPTLHAVAPIFQVAHLQRGIDFYTQILGFDIAWTWGTPPDRASLCRDRVEITLEVAPAPTPSKVYIQVNGVDEYYARVTTAGAKLVVPLADRVYGMRDCRIEDPDGNAIAIGESIVKE
jgi:catechol 2,3-dioxygenase-like lactoylglutathione lyase family enzyme